MKSKNRRSSASRSNPGSEDNRMSGRDGPELPTSDEVHSVGTKRKKPIESTNTSTRSSKLASSPTTAATTNTTSTTATTPMVNVASGTIPPGTNLSNGGESKVTTKKKRNTVSTSGGSSSANGKAFSINANHRRHHSQSNSSASSVVSGPGEPIDPYEFAVKTEDDLTDCGINTSVAPMKRMKLDRVEDRCLPDSARSSPLPQTVFSHPSPGANSSPLTVHHHHHHHHHQRNHHQHRHRCTRPLSVLTDFNQNTAATPSSVSSASSASSASSSTGSVHRNLADSESGRRSTGLNGSSTTASQSIHSVTPSISSPPRLHRNSTTPEPELKHTAAHRTNTPLTNPAMDVNGIPRPHSTSDMEFETTGITSHPISPIGQCCVSLSTDAAIPSIITTTMTMTTTTNTTTTTAMSAAATATTTTTTTTPNVTSDSSSVGHATPPVLIPSAKSEPRCVGVNTVLEDLCKATITEPDLLGPCEPGTTICLNGIVWLETTTGVLVVNVTWRGRTYIGTLLDATQHDFAPPCPRDYVSPFKSSVRSSNRTKRRTGAVGSNFKHSHSTNTANGTSTNGVTPNNTDARCNTSGSQRPRLRGRTTNSPATGPKGSTNVASESAPVPRSSNARPTPSPTPVAQTVTATTGGCLSAKLNGEDLDEQAGPLLLPCSDEDRTTPTTNNLAINTNRERETVLEARLTPTQSKGHAISSSSSDCPSENLMEGDKLREPEVSVDHSSPPPPPPAPLQLVSSSDAVSQAIGPSPNTITATTTNTNQSDLDRSDGDEDEVDDEINSSFPITCPLAGCKKRFTHVIALRFHLNHTPHNGPKRHTDTHTQQTVNTTESVSSAASVLNTSAASSFSVPSAVPLPSASIVPPAPAPPQPPLHCSHSPPIRPTTITNVSAPPRAVVPPIPIQTVPPGLHPSPSGEPDGPNLNEMRHLGPAGPAHKADPTHSVLFGSGDTYRGVGGTSFSRPTGTVGTVTHEQAPPGPSTRTVTAHTVSVPHGPLVDKVDLTQTGRGTNTCNTINTSTGHPPPTHHSTHSKRTNPNSRSAELTKLPRTSSTGTVGRVPNSNLSLTSSCPKPGELAQHQQQQQQQQRISPSRHHLSRSGPKDTVEFTSHLPPSGINSLRQPDINNNGASLPIGSFSQFGSNLALFSPSSSSYSVVPTANPINSRLDPTSNPLFALPPEMWPFSPPINTGEQRAISSFHPEADSAPSGSTTSRYSTGPGMWMNGATFPPGMNHTSPTTNTGVYTPSHHPHGGNARSANSTAQSISISPTTTTTSTAAATAATAPGFAGASAPNLLDSSGAGAYGLPDFLMAAAAMSNALSPTHPMNNPAVMEMLRSYMNQSGLGKSAIPPHQLPQSVIAPNGPQTSSTSKPLPTAGLPHLSLPPPSSQPPPACIPPLPPTGPNSTASLAPSASLASMMMAAAAAAAAAGSGAPNPALLPPSMMHAAFGLAQNQPVPPSAQPPSNLLSNPAAGFDGLDPFKFSAAYLMQQATSGPQLSSGFTQQSS